MFPLDETPVFFIMPSPNTSAF